MNTPAQSALFSLPGAAMVASYAFIVAVLLLM